MYILMFVFWVILNGKLNLEITLFGLVICAALYWFISKFMGYRIEGDLLVLKSLAGIMIYLTKLTIEVIKANLATAKMILSFTEEPEPVLVTFTPDLKTDTAKTALANSITLTPGTITIDVHEDGSFLVHALDKSFAEGIDTCDFVKDLKVLEDKALADAGMTGSSEKGGNQA